MGDKSIRKKSLIVDKAREVFSKKGFLTVSMKDIVEACEISRGGLYLYFEDTEKIFLEVLKKDAGQEDEAEVEQADTAVEMLSLILREQKKELLSRDNPLTAALYEYYFSKTRQEGFGLDHILSDEKDRFEMAVRVVERLIRGGIREGYFDCEDPIAEAYNMMIAIEGMKILKATVGISEKLVTDEINYLFSHLFIREESPMADPKQQGAFGYEAGRGPLAKGLDPDKEPEYDDDAAYEEGAAYDEDLPDAEYDGDAEYDEEAAYDEDGAYDADAEYDEDAAYDADAEYDEDAEYDADEEYDEDAEYEEDAEYDADTEYDEADGYDVTYDDRSYRRRS